ncbi:TIGR03643 family protein [Pararhodonellum marinum]|uniref:TIGR03643 family protein n=1 Tax=Pararhodonellum marinum TaxID=2755358 RepID=UPI00188EA6A8|nr:TIGR03643 family protein [Pararhodonellum marinum]
MKLPEHINHSEIDRIIEMAWEDRTPFQAIEFQFGLAEQAVIELMRGQLKPASFRLWRRRVQGRKTKHAQLGHPEANRFKSNLQRTITHNRISKR